jgi:hypothetical protein
MAAIVKKSNVSFGLIVFLVGLMYFTQNSASEVNLFSKFTLGLLYIPGSVKNNLINTKEV